MPSPALSIIIPTFNRLNFLRTAIASVFSQTFKDWELIIADDGSGPETAAYLEALQNPPQVEVLRLSHSGNPGAVRNAALHAANGALVAFLDSDDTWSPTKLERQVVSLLPHTHRRWSYTAYDEIDELGAPLPPQNRRKWTGHEGAIFEQVVKTEAFLRTPSVVVAERRLVLELGGFDERQFFAEDYDLWVRLALHAEAAVVNEPLVHVRVHPDSY